MLRFASFASAAIATQFLHGCTPVKNEDTSGKNGSSAKAASLYNKAIKDVNAEIDSSDAAGIKQTRCRRLKQQLDDALKGVDQTGSDASAARQNFSEVYTECTGGAVVPNSNGVSIGGWCTYNTDCQSG